MQMYETLMAIRPEKALILQKMGMMTMHESSDLKTDSSSTDEELTPNFEPQQFNVGKDLQKLYRVREKLVRSSSNVQKLLPLVAKNDSQIDETSSFDISMTN